MNLELAINSERKEEEIGLEFLQKFRAAVRYEIEHSYINAIGKTGDFTNFISREAEKALKIFKHSHKWSSIKILMERYPVLDLASRMRIIKQIWQILDELEDSYKAFSKPNTVLSDFPVNLDISELNIQYVKGVGPTSASKLNKLGIFTCEDLLNYLPRSHISYEEKTLISDLKPDTDVTVLGSIQKVTAYKAGKKDLIIINITVKDPSGQIKINKYFQGNSINFYLKQYKSQFPYGTQVLCAGKTKYDKFSKKITLQNPIIETISTDFIEEGEAAKGIHAGRIVPIYPLTEGISLIQLRRLIYKSLNLYKSNIREFIPQSILDKHRFMDYAEAVQEIHFPTDIDAKNQAANRLLFNEFFLMQVHFMQIRHKTTKENQGIKFNCFENGLLDKFVNSLPFKLTHAQERVFYQEILPDLVRETPMHRLLQGDVGSGKTIVAFMALLVAVADGYQGAIMVPTEILAEQHYNKFLDWLSRMDEMLKIKVALLIGKQTVKQKQEILNRLASGMVDIVVGTHALIQDTVGFKNLGLVVIDEQHRFGVKQRDMLAKKAKHPIEKLFMTATPIPRTLALAMHGDLDMSEIDEMPLGRLPIKTEIVRQKADAYRLIKEEIAKANQAYIVFPLIDESEALSAKAATAEYNKLKDTVFKDYKIGLLHGRMQPQEKDSVMKSFRNSELDILVSTTVIEVGVDVANATVMMIESAERFGLAQLHQLRGRVGRNDKQSYCLLSSHSKSPANFERLRVLTNTNNGFIVAQQDLKFRGAGDFAGLRQSGLPESALQGLADQEELLTVAREAARMLIDENPKLSGLETLQKKLIKSVYSSSFDAG